MPRISQRDIAEKCGVSQKTVSLALADSPRISRQRKDEVRRVAAELGYQADGVISAAFQRIHGISGHQNTGTVIVAISGHRAGCRKNRAASSFLEALQTLGRGQNLGLDVIFPEEELSGTPDRLETMLRGRGCCGCILYEPLYVFQNHRSRFFEILLQYPAVGLLRSTNLPQPPVLIQPEMHSLIYRAEKICRKNGFQAPGLVLPEKDGGAFWLEPSDPEAKLPALVAPSLGMPVLQWKSCAAEEVDRWAERQNLDCLIMDPPVRALDDAALQSLVRSLDYPVIFLDTTQFTGAKPAGFSIDWPSAAREAFDALLAQLAGTIFHNPHGTKMILQAEFHPGEGLRSRRKSSREDRSA